MSEKIKVAIIGCGAIANSAHIPAYMKNEKAEIKYFCDIIPERADAAVENTAAEKRSMTITRYLTIRSLIRFPSAPIMTCTRS